MLMKRPVVDYRKFRLNRLNTDEFQHLKLLLYWPAFGALFLYAERFIHVAYYHPMHCALDNYVPFCEWFAFPYLFWFVFLVGMHAYTLLYDIPAFKRMMKFIIFTYSTALLIYFLYPNCQYMRPTSFERDNVLTRFMTAFYAFDTNTNVCPSLHVIGSLAVYFASRDIKRFCTPLWHFGFLIATILISISTIFLKQHSILDLVAAVLVCSVAYVLVYRAPERYTVPARMGRSGPEKSPEL